MDAFLFMRDTFHLIGGKFDEVAQAIDGVPVIGGYLAAPFYWFADNFDWVGDLFQNASDFFDWLQGLYEALPVWDTIRAQIEATWVILTKNAEGVYLWIKPYIPAIPAWIPTSLDEMKTLVLSWVPPIPDWIPTTLAEMKELVLSWIPPIPDWIPTTLAEMKELVLSWVPPIPDWIPTTLDELVELVKDQLPEIPTKDTILGFVTAAINEIVDAAIAWVDEQIEDYKERLWALFEKLLDKIQL